MKHLILGCALVSLMMLGLAMGKSIAAIEVESQRGEVYIVDDGTPPTLHMLDNADLSETEAHYLPGTAVVKRGVYVRRIGNKRQLMVLLKGNETELAAFKIPLSNKPTLPALRRSFISSGTVGLTPLWDSLDNILLVTISRNISSVDLNTLQVLDSVLEWGGSRLTGRNAIYNHNNNHLTAFRTRRPIRGSWGVSASEYDLTNKTLESVEPTYSCFCQEPLNDTLSPFYHTTFLNCDIDYTRNKVWCADSISGRLFALRADNMTQFDIYDTNSTFDRIVWDFTSRRAYTIKLAENDEDEVDDGDTGEVEEPTGFTVTKYNLLNGAVLGTYTDTITVVDPSVATKDPEEPNLYIAVADSNETTPAQVVVLNTVSLTAQTLTLTKPVEEEEEEDDA